MATRRDFEQTSFLYGGNSSYIEELYARYLTDPSSIDTSWRAYFDDLEPENRGLFTRSRAALATEVWKWLRIGQPGVVRDTVTSTTPPSETLIDRTIPSVTMSCRSSGSTTTLSASRICSLVGMRFILAAKGTGPLGRRFEPGGRFAAKT